MLPAYGSTPTAGSWRGSEHQLQAISFPYRPTYLYLPSPKAINAAKLEGILEKATLVSSQPGWKVCLVFTHLQQKNDIFFKWALKKSNFFKRLVGQISTSLEARGIQNNIAHSSRNFQQAFLLQRLIHEETSSKVWKVPLSALYVHCFLK